MNKFEVDLGNLDLTEKQRLSINTAIQNAVANEVAKMDLKKQIVLIPTFKGRLPGPLINGIYVRPLSVEIFKDLVKTVG